MVRIAWTRRSLLVAAGGATTLGGLGLRVAAQPEFMSGQGMPYAAFDRLPNTDLPVKDGVVHVGFAAGDLDLPRPVILDWIRRSARAVAVYYGRFPVPSVRLLVVPVAGRGVMGGTTWGYRGAAIRMLMGRAADEPALRRDWMMVHEMVHLALPDVGQHFAWLAEGLAVYIEPIARVQAGDLTAETIWADMVRDMPQGLPRGGHGGLDGSRDWGRTYWGGALFCLKADVEIRLRTDNRLGLQDAMRGVLAAGGSHEANWLPGRIFAVADETVGTDVLRNLYATMGSQPVAPDLPALWRDLGIRRQGASVAFDESAPLTPIRKAITAGRSP